MSREPVVEKTFGVSTLAGDETLGTPRRLCVHGRWGAGGGLGGRQKAGSGLRFGKTPGLLRGGGPRWARTAKGGWGPVQQEWVGSEVRREMASSLPDSREREE